MRTIKNMPDTLVGGIAKILLGRTTSLKDTSFLDVTPIHLEVRTLLYIFFPMEY